MIFWNLFIHSLKLPNKQAMFKINRAGMDIMLIYMLILMAIVSIPSFISIRSNPDEMSAQVNIIFQIVYFLIFSYLPLVIILFLLLSGVAFITKGMSKLLHRKLKYSLLWKQVAATTTIPFLVYTIVALIYPINEKWLWLFIPYSLLMMLKVITVFPRRRKKRSGGRSLKESGTT